MTTPTSDRGDRTVEVLEIFAQACAATTPFLQRVAECEHLPTWPAAPTTPAEALAGLDQVEELLGQIGRCACHHGMPEQIYARTVLRWLDVARAAVDYARSRADRDTVDDAVRALHRHITFWSTPRTVLGLALDLSPTKPTA